MGNYTASGGQNPVLPNIDRLVHVAWRARNSPKDFKNGKDLGKASNSSYGAIRDWCRAADIDARRFALFVRFFRAAWLAVEQGARITDFVDIVKPSVLKRDLQMAGGRERPISVQAYCRTQTFLVPESAIVTRLLAILSEVDFGSHRGR